MKRIIFIVLGFLVITSCKTLNKNVTHEQMIAMGSNDAKLLVNTPDYKKCNEGKKEIDDITVKNNLWGKAKVKSGRAELCTYVKGDTYGWEWKVDKGASGVIGYPAIEVGRSPWGNKSRKGEDGFPIKVTEIESLPVSYDFETLVKHKKFNLSFDIWLTDVPNANKDNITTEIMIWEDYFDFSSYGKVIDKIATPFGLYKVYKGYLKNEDYSQDWVYLAFVRETPRSQGEVEIKYFLDYLIRKNHISQNDYFASVELGNEIGNSSGLTLVRNFEWDLKIK
jgi:hypothetical protein